MAVNKVVYDGNTIIDITDTNIDVNKIPNGSVVYLANGNRTVGTAIVYNAYNGLDKTESGFALDARQGKVLKDLIDGGVTGVKGNAENNYRTGNVNLTSANIGALPLTGGTLTGALTIANQTLRIRNDGYQFVIFQDSSGQEHGHVRGNFGAGDNRIAFREHNAALTKYEDYFLPTPTATNANDSYDILTSKTCGTVVNGTKASPSCANSGGEATAATLELSKGNWIVFASGYSPIMASSKVVSQATTIWIQQGSNSSYSGGVSLTYRFAVSKFISITSDSATIYLKVKNWESYSVDALGTSYDFYAVRIS